MLTETDEVYITDKYNVENHEWLQIVRKRKNGHISELNLD